MTDDTAADANKDKARKAQRRETLTDDLIRAEFAEASRVRYRGRDSASEHPPQLGSGAEDQDDKSPPDTPDQGPAHSEGCPRRPKRKQQE